MEKKYFLAKGKKHLGAFSLTELQTMNLSPDTLIWSEDLGHWTKASEITELKDFIISVPPPTPYILENQITKDKNKKYFKDVIYRIIKAGKQTLFPFLLLFVVIFFVLILSSKFGNGYIGKDWEIGNGLYPKLSSDGFIPLAEPYCYWGIFIKNDEIWKFLFQISLFWALVFSIIIFIVLFFKIGSKKGRPKTE